MRDSAEMLNWTAVICLGLSILVAIAAAVAAANCLAYAHIAAKHGETMRRLIVEDMQARLDSYRNRDQKNTPAAPGNS